MMSAGHVRAENVPNFILLSHHERTRKTSPCSSVYQAFVGEDRIADLAGYCHMGGDPGLFAEDLTRQINSVDSPHLLFNGFKSLLTPSSRVALSLAVVHELPVTIYWHETAWNLRVLASRAATNFRILKDFLPAIKLTNWVPTSQCLHVVAAIFGLPLDTFRIVNEIVDLRSFRPSPSISSSGQVRPLVIAGAGLPDLRKGIDLFSVLSHEIGASSRRSLEFRWYAATANVVSCSVPYPDSIRWMGHSPHFHESLRDVDVFVLTSRDDPSPLVVFEALASGLPVFAFASTGCSEVLPPEFIARDLADMREKLTEYLRNFRPDPARFRAIAENYSVAHFKERAFRNTGSAVAQLANVDGGMFADTQTVLGLALLREASLMTIAAARAAEEIGSRKAIVGIAGRLAADLRIEYHRSACRKARRIRPLEFGLPYIIRRKLLRVLVLDNAPDVLAREAGREIDRFDVVVRVGDFRTRGLEKHVGSKTTYAVISPTCNPSEELNAISKSNVFVLGGNLGDDYGKIADRLTDRDCGCHVLPPRSNVLRSSLYRDLMKVDLGLDPGGDRLPSLAIVAVQWARDIHGSAAEVWVHGFDFCEGSRTAQFQSSARKSAEDDRHDFVRERDYLEKLIGSGKVKRL